jgi:hypothetical protein
MTLTIASHDTPPREEPAICDDVLSLAKEVSHGDREPPVYVAGPTALHAAKRDVKLDDTTGSRIAAVDSAVWEQTTRSSPDGHTKIFFQPRLGAGPRAALRQAPRQLASPTLDVHAPAVDIDNSGNDGNDDRLPSYATSAEHASAATAGLPADTPDYNNATADNGA